MKRKRKRLTVEREGKENSDEEQERQESEEESETDSRYEELPKVRNILFGRYYKGPTHYYPGNTFDYEFEDCEADEDTKHALKKEFFIRKKKITSSLKKLFQKDRIIMKRSPLLYPCYFRGCTFEGRNLGRHLECKEHQLSSPVSKTQQSYLTRQVNFLTKVSKSKQNEPLICPKCHLFFDRIDLHLHSRHQLRRKGKMN